MKLLIDIHNITFRELTPSLADLHAYRQHVVPGMNADDIYSPEEFHERLADGRLSAWWAEYNSEIIGWCALGTGHNKYRPKADHLFGVWVHPDARRQGLADAMWKFRIGLVSKDTSITVSIQPDKTGSLILAKRYGFQEISEEPPWINYALDR